MEKEIKTKNFCIIYSGQDDFIECEVYADFDIRHLWLIDGFGIELNDPNDKDAIERTIYERALERSIPMKYKSIREDIHRRYVRKSWY